jgi:hypothetical protein
MSDKTRKAIAKRLERNQPAPKPKPVPKPKPAE